MKIKFKEKIIIGAIIIAIIPLLLSYVIFVVDKVHDFRNNVKSIIKNTAVTIAMNDEVKDELEKKIETYSIQEYAKQLIANIEDVDLIVICDMDGKKYSHLDESQIGEIYVNPDKAEVLKNGSSYYSLMEGSMGKTLRWFEPIMRDDVQVGFVMVGKYYNDITNVNSKTIRNYIILFIGTLTISILGANFFATITKKSILNMEPEEIAKLYKEKEIVINNVQDGIIALDKNYNLQQVNNNCYKLIEEFKVEEVIDKLEPYIHSKQSVIMKEVIIQKKKIFVTVSPIIEYNQYLGVVIVLSDKTNINRVAKEITGVDEIIKNLRANIHEFKNNLHIISGLIQLKEYEQAKEYILNIQKVEEENLDEFIQIQDYYVRALLISKKLIAKEKKVTLRVKKESSIYKEHGIIEWEDITTILGNLIENALEACVVNKKDKDSLVEVYLNEDSKKIEIEVTDNGIVIDEKIREYIFLQGISSKGKGRGTGLYLVSNRVELYNGNISIKQYEDNKSFYVTIYKGVKNE